VQQYSSFLFSNLHFGSQYENVEFSGRRISLSDHQGSKVDSSVFSSINFAGVNGQWTFSNGGDEKIRTKGIQLTGGFSFLNNLDNTARKMLNLNAAVSVYHTFFKRLTFAHRTGAGTIFGDYEFYHANSLGGDHNLRGFWRNRFAAKSNFYQNTELRLTLCDLGGYVVRGKFGIFRFIDVGRVWIRDENSTKLHTGYGGGIFLVPYRLAALSLYYASSNEANSVILRAGFLF
jgi:hemolysin activation/secretion protein